MGLRITTDDKGVKVIRQDKVSANGNPYTRYSLMVSTKDNDEWVNAFIDCAFPKGTNIENKTIIKIKDAFYLASEYQGKSYTKIYVKDFEIVSTGNPAPQTDADGFMTVTEDADLPFAQPNR